MLTDQELHPMITAPKVIAVVGLSDKPERPSYQVASYLLDQGFTIIPVNPTISEVFGLSAYPSLETIPNTIHIDIVDIFRQSDAVLPIVKTVIETSQKPLIWMQEGVISPEAQKLAEMNGLKVVMDQCLMKTHRRLGLTR